MTAGHDGLISSCTVSSDGSGRPVGGLGVPGSELSEVGSSSETMHADDDAAVLSQRAASVEAELMRREESHSLRVFFEREARRVESSCTRRRWWRCVTSERSAATRRTRMMGAKMKIQSRIHPR